LGARLGEDARPNYLRYTGHPLSRNERPLRPKVTTTKSKKRSVCIESVVGQEEKTRKKYIESRKIIMRSTVP
jgi:hypothetical protein